MKPELYKYVDTARKHEDTGPQPPVEVNRTDQAQTGVEWCRRQANRPPEPPVEQGPKAYPVPN
jgi:hypothetical protein